MALAAYRKKRDFTATTKPKGGAVHKGGNSFVIHKRQGAARRIAADPAG
jgi:hypothetical protein